MINKINVLKNIGKFYYYASKSGELEWHKNTFFYAPNAHGKSTLVNVFQSLCNNNTKLILARKTVNATALPEAVIVVDGISHVFNGTNWNKSCPGIHIFDVPFIHANIFTHEIEHQHRKNIHKIIIGEKGIVLAQKLLDLKNEEKGLRKQQENLVKHFLSAGLVHTTLESFLSIPAIEETEVADRIKKLEHDIKSKESEEKVRALSNPQTINSLDFNLNILRNIVLQKVTTMHEDAEKRVLEHIGRNFKNKSISKDFIRQGLDMVQADCPFCGQDLHGASELLAAYRQYFDNTFREFQKQLAQEAERFKKWNLDNELTKLVSIHNANNATVKQWEPYIGIIELMDIPTVVESFRLNLGELKAKVQSEIERKQKDPNVDFDFSLLDGFAFKLTALKKAVVDYNDSVNTFIVITKNYIENLPKSDLSFLQRALVREQEIEKRFRLEWKKWAIDYESAKKKLEDVLNQKNTKQKELEIYTKTIFNTYQKRINELLFNLGADFAITELSGKSDERANEAYSDFAFLILEKKVPLVSKQEDTPCFKNTLSEGDKSTLAFAFLLRRLNGYRSWINKSLF